MIEWRKGDRRARGILREQPEDGFLGIIECSIDGCGEQRILKCTHDEDGECMTRVHGREILDFMLTHRCGAHDDPN